MCFSNLFLSSVFKVFTWYLLVHCIIKRQFLPILYSNLCKLWHWFLLVPWLHMILHLEAFPSGKLEPFMGRTHPFSCYAHFQLNMGNTKMRIAMWGPGIMMNHACCMQRLSTESRTHPYSNPSVCGEVQYKDHHHLKSLLGWKYRDKTNVLLREKVVKRSKPWRMSFAYLWKAYCHKWIVLFWHVSKVFCGPCEMCRSCLFTTQMWLS